MVELSFRLSLYSPAAIDRAVEVFADFANFERRTDNEVEVVRLTAKPGADESSIAGELANYVLGGTVDFVGSSAVSKDASTAASKTAFEAASKAEEV
jgi:hypothetical protein